MKYYLILTETISNNSKSSSSFINDIAYCIGWLVGCARNIFMWGLVGATLTFIAYFLIH